MFFDMDLLCRQRQGKFGLIWLAATRGITTVKKRDIEAVNLTRICNEILKYVMSQSTSPKKRLSLYLSAKLLYGTVLVYRQQVIYFEHTIGDFYFAIKKPLITIDSDNKDKTKKRKAIRPKKAKLPEISEVTQAERIRGYAQEYEHALPDINANIIDSIHITLPDGDVGMVVDKPPNLFGDEGQIDEQLAQLCGDNWINIPDAPVPEIIANPEHIIVDPEIAQAPETINNQGILPAVNTTSQQSKRLVRSPEESPSKRKRLASENDSTSKTRSTASAAVEEVQAQEGIIIRNEQDQRNVVQAQVEPNEQEEQEVQMPPPRRPPVRARRRLNVPRIPRSPLRIAVETPRNWQRTRLDQPSMDLQTIKRSPAQRAADDKNDPKELVALILAGVRHDDSDIISVFRGAQENVSNESVRTNLTTGDNILGKTFEPIAEQDSHIEEILPAPQNLNIMEIDNMTIQPLVSPRFSNILRENAEEMNISEIHPPRLYASTPKSSEDTFETELTRQNNLLDRIRKLFLENGNTAIKLEQLCDILSRPKISKTFCDLLYLHGKQYIRMESSSETLELENIYPGEKLQE